MHPTRPPARRTAPAQPMANPLFAAALFAAALAASGCGQRADAQGGRPPAAPVSVAPAVQRSVVDSEEFSGRLEAAEFVELRPRVGGTLAQVHFQDGALVAKGQLLFSIDARPFAAEVARAESVLAAAQSRAELAQSELARAKTLLESKAVSRQEFDQLSSGARTSAADIQAAQAALRVAQLNLDYATVRAPIAGRASRANVTAGNLVNEQVVLTTIAGVAKVHAYFDSSEQIYLRFKAAASATAGGTTADGTTAGGAPVSGKPGSGKPGGGTPVGGKADKGPAAPAVRMGLANEAGHPHEGRIDFVDNRLSAQTGAIRLRASFDNAKGQFTPGLVARITMPVSAPYDAVLVPERAIGTDQSKKFVFVVGADGMPQFREVQPGALQGGMRVVGGGQVKAGENVIVDGLQRVIPGLPVAPQVLPVDASGMPIFPPPAAPGAAPKPADQKAGDKADEKKPTDKKTSAAPAPRAG